MVINIGRLKSVLDVFMSERVLRDVQRATDLVIISGMPLSNDLAFVSRSVSVLLRMMQHFNGRSRILQLKKLSALYMNTIVMTSGAILRSAAMAL